MVAIVYLTPAAPSKLAADLTLAGVTVWEALFAAEALHLCETEHVDAVVIDADVTDPELAEVRAKYITLELKPQATAADILWELSQLLPGTTKALQ